MQQASHKHHRQNSKDALIDKKVRCERRNSHILRPADILGEQPFPGCDTRVRTSSQPHYNQPSRTILPHLKHSRGACSAIITPGFSFDDWGLWEKGQLFDVAAVFGQPFAPQ